MSADKLVFDLSQEIEGSPQVFIKKDWLNILDNMNQNYSANQMILDTSQLSNSNKWMNYREAYLAMPLLMTLTSSTAFAAPAVTGGVTDPAGFNPTTATVAIVGGVAGSSYPTACDYAMGLKNWFGSIIHSFTLDCNGTTIIQQTPLISMINCFRLLTSLSWGDVITQGSTIGFYPDCPTSFMVNGGGGSTAGGTSGQGVCNNSLYPSALPISATVLTSTGATANGSGSSATFNNYNSQDGNMGLLKRIQMINLAPEGVVGGTGTTALTGKPSANALTYAGLMTGGATAMNTLWLSHINAHTVVGNLGIQQISIMATIYLKHIHNFFAMIPLLKGVFFKMTAFLNNSVVNFQIAGKTYDATSVATIASSLPGIMTLVGSPSIPVGGVNPIMLTDTTYQWGGTGGLGNGQYCVSLAVGSKIINPTQSAFSAYTGGLATSVYLYTPAYTFNPVFESAYLSSPVKEVKYSDYYQYQVQNVGAGSQFNQLLTNGISNIVSVTIFPFYSAGAGATLSGLPAGVPVYQSPFDTAGAGTTSPFCLFTSFNVVISGQNSIYNTERYVVEQYNNQLKGCNSVNGDLTDGLTSGLVDALGFQSSQCFWYVNVGRQLPVEMAVPKSVQIIGQNLSAFPIDLICFIEYQVSVSFDTLTGARV